MKNLIKLALMISALHCNMQLINAATIDIINTTGAEVKVTFITTAAEAQGTQTEKNLSGRVPLEKRNVIESPRVYQRVERVLKPTKIKQRIEEQKIDPTAMISIVDPVKSEKLYINDIEAPLADVITNDDCQITIKSARTTGPSRVALVPNCPSGTEFIQRAKESAASSTSETASKTAIAAKSSVTEAAKPALTTEEKERIIKDALKIPQTETLTPEKILGLKEGYTKADVQKAESALLEEWNPAYKIIEDESHQQIIFKEILKAAESLSSK